MRNPTSVRLLVCVVIALGPNSASAQLREPIPIEDALGTHAFAEQSPIAISPDGKWVAYVVLDNQKPRREKIDQYPRTGVYPEVEGGDIWISNIESGASRNLTRDGSNWRPSWSPDGNYLAFLSDRDGSGQARLWIWDSRKDELRLVSPVGMRGVPLSEDLLWTPDSRKIVTTTIPQGLSADEYAQKVATPTSDESDVTNTRRGSSVLLYEGNLVLPGASPSSAMFNWNEPFMHDLAVVDVAGGSVNYIVHGPRIERFVLSPDGTQVAFAVPKHFRRPGSFSRVYDIMTVDVVTKNERLLAADVFLNDLFSWSPDGSLIAFIADAADEKSYEFYVVGAIGGTPRRLGTVSHKTGRSLSPIWEPTGQHFWFVLDGALWRTGISDGVTLEWCRIKNRAIKFVLTERDSRLWVLDRKSVIVVARDEEGKQDGFYRVALPTGVSTKLYEEGWCFTCYWPASRKGSYLAVVSPTGRDILYVAENAQHAPDLWVGDPAFRIRRQVTHLNPQFERYEMGTAKLIDWLSDDGNRLHGALLLPAGYQSEKKYPLLVWVYPGVSQSQDLDHFAFGIYPGPLNLQLFATRGYAVLFPDTTEEVGRRPAGLLSSVLPGVNKAIDIGVADPRRLGLIGYSQGGFATLEMLVQTKRFKAAVAGAGWGDSTAYYGAMDSDGSGYQYGQAESQLGGPPWRLPMTYIENSPFYYLDRVDTPLLLVHGAADSEIPAFLSDEVFVGLRRLGKRVEYAKYQGEPHVPWDWSYANQIDLANRVVAWFGKYLQAPAD